MERRKDESVDAVFGGAGPGGFGLRQGNAAGQDEPQLCAWPAGQHLV